MDSLNKPFIVHVLDGSGVRRCYHIFSSFYRLQYCLIKFMFYDYFSMKIGFQFQCTWSMLSVFTGVRVAHLFLFICICVIVVICCLCLISLSSIFFTVIFKLLLESWFPWLLSNIRNSNKRLETRRKSGVILNYFSKQLFVAE